MAVSRRGMLSMSGAGLLGLSTISLSNWIDEANAMTIRVRYDAASDEGKAMLDIYADAVGQMKAMNPQSPLAWRFQFYTHWMNVEKDATIEAIYGPDLTPEKMAAIAMWDTCRGHLKWTDQGRWFVPWHRMYVLYFERIIQQVSGESDFTLPYWNYTEAATRFIPEPFRDPSSPLYVANRNRGINDGRVGMEGLSLDFMERSDYDGRTGFNSTLDGNPHGSIHVQVGTRSNMGNVPTAANDPVFWVHHANIDRCWASWNAAGGQNPMDAAYKDMQFQFFDVATNQHVVATTADFTSTESLGYTYATLIAKPSPALAMARAALPPQAMRETIMQAGSEGEFRVGETSLTLGAGPAALSVPLPDVPATTLLRGQANGQRLYLLIDDLRTDIQPGVIYQVFLGGDGVDPVAIGQVNFFNAAAKDAENTSASAFSFDVSSVLGQLYGDAPPEAPVVTIAPLGEPAANAEPLLGHIRFVLE